MGACLKKGSWDPLANYESNTYRRRKLPTIQQWAMGSREEASEGPTILHIRFYSLSNK